MDLERLNARAAEIAERETQGAAGPDPGFRSPVRAGRQGAARRCGIELPGQRPLPVYLSRGKGPKVWDVDGTEYTDFHGGFGVNVVGHAHPKIVEATEEGRRGRRPLRRHHRGHRGAGRGVCASGSRCDQVRFVNSGTEATMDAIRVARAATGKDRVVKMEGSYHGHHDAVLFSVVPEADVLGLRAQHRRRGRRQLGSCVHHGAHVQGRPARHCGTTRSSCRSTTWPRSPSVVHRARRRDRRADPRARDDEHRHRRAAGRLPPGPARPVRRARRRADLRRGEVRRHHRLRRGHRALRRVAAPGRLGQGHRRRRPRSAPSAARPT